jgi:hypothetical protein
MPAKKYIVKLTQDERDNLTRLVRKGGCAGWKVQRAQVLLACDVSEEGLGWPDEKLSEAYGCSVRSLESWRKQAVEEGPLSLLTRKPLEPRPLKLDGECEAQLVKLVCSEPPHGRSRWCLRLLADRLVELEVVESISHETVRRVLKKTTLSLGER